MARKLTRQAVIKYEPHADFAAMLLHEVYQGLFQGTETYNIIR